MKIMKGVKRIPLKSRPQARIVIVLYFLNSLAGMTTAIAWVKALKKPQIKVLGLTARLEKIAVGNQNSRTNNGYCNGNQVNPPRQLPALQGHVGNDQNRGQEDQDGRRWRIRRFDRVKVGELDA